MENDLKGNENYFELTRGSCYRGFELPGVDCMYHPSLFVKLYPSIVYILWSFLLIVGAMSVTDFTNLINVDVVVFVVSIPNESERKSNKRIRNGF